MKNIKSNLDFPENDAIGPQAFMDWTLVGGIVAHKDGNEIIPIEGQSASLEQFASAPVKCDHCGSGRPSSGKYYVLQNPETGELKVIGTACYKILAAQNNFGKMTSSKKSVKLSKREWLNIGKKAGWIKKKAQQMPFDSMDATGLSFEEEIAEAFSNQNDPKISELFRKNTPAAQDYMMKMIKNLDLNPMGILHLIKNMSITSVALQLLQRAFTANNAPVMEALLQNQDFSNHINEMENMTSWAKAWDKKTPVSSVYKCDRLLRQYLQDHKTVA